MPAVRQLLKRAEIETAAGKRMCHRKRDEHKILEGDVCLVIRDPDGRAKNYCVACALPILDQARTTLDMLAAGLGLDQPESAEPTGSGHVAPGSTDTELEA